MKLFTKIDPLTEEESRYAAEHYALIYKFLNKKQLPEEDFFDVVVFGYLRAVKRYLEEEGLRRWAFTTIAWRAMKLCVRNYRHAQKADCRNAVVLSLDMTPEDGATLSLYEVIPGSSPDPASSLEEKMAMADICSRLTREQRKVVSLRDRGFSDEEISDILDLPQERLNSHMGRLISLFSDGPDAA